MSEREQLIQLREQDLRNRMAGMPEHHINAAIRGVKHMNFESHKDFDDWAKEAVDQWKTHVDRQEDAADVQSVVDKTVSRMFPGSHNSEATDTDDKQDDPFRNFRI